MVLGHDFHSEVGYRASFRAGGERLTLPTWSNLVELLAVVGLAPEYCFFTNLYMGLRAGACTTGPFPGASNPIFVKHCQAFLCEQVQVQRPSLILTLGINVPPVLGKLSPELALWTRGKGLKYLDAVGPVCSKVTLYGVKKYKTTVVVLTHPSLRHANLQHRRYQGAVASEAELRMLKDGMAYAGFAAS